MHVLTTPVLENVRQVTSRTDKQLSKFEIMWSTNETTALFQSSQNGFCRRFSAMCSFSSILSILVNFHTLLEWKGLVGNFVIR